MAIPIKETPVLTGRDAQRFEERMRQVENQHVSGDDYRRARAVYDDVHRRIEAATER